MAWALSDYVYFTDTATARGAPVGPFAQIEVFGSPSQKRDGAGNLVFVTPGDYATALTKANIAGYQCAVEGVMGPWNDAWDANAGYDILGRIVDPPTFNPGPIGAYMLRIQNTGIAHTAWIRLYQTATHLSDAFFTPAHGHYYKWRLELTTGAPGHTMLRGLVADMVAPTTWIADTLLSAGQIDDATAALNNPMATYKYGIGGSGAPYEPSDLATQSFAAYSFVPDAAGGAKRSVQV